MTCQILIVSYWKDAEWTLYCLKSISKFATGFLKTTLAIPTRDLEVFKPIIDQFDLNLVLFEEREGKGMLHHMVIICHADEYCEADVIVHMDSDCHFFAPVTPETYLYQGKPMLFRLPYEQIKETPNYKWKEAAERALGFECDYETMARHPLTYRRELYPKVRAHIETHVQMPFDEYVLSQRNEFPQTFAEHSTLGAYANKFMSHEYSLFDRIKGVDGKHKWYPDVPEDYVGVFWSHSGMTEVERAKLQEITK